MTKIAQRIRDLAERLEPGQQEALLEIAQALAGPTRAYDTLSDEERQELDEAIAEDERGETVTQEELDADLDAVFERRGV